MRMIFSCLALATVVLGGCQTGAQREAQRIMDRATKTRADYDVCIAKVESQAQFQGVLAKLPHGTGGTMPLALLANTDLATEDDVAALYALHQERQPCRQIALQGVAEVHPALVSVLAQSYAEQDQDYVRLVRRDLSWGDYAQSFSERRAKFTTQLDATIRQIDQELANAHSYELQQRQQASQALMLWSAQQQLLYQQQQYLNRPRLTNCQYQGAFLNCTTF